MYATLHIDMPMDEALAHIVLGNQENQEEAQAFDQTIFCDRPEIRLEPEGVFFAHEGAD